MQNSIQHDSASTLFQSMFHTKIKEDESFDSFRTRLLTVYRSCIKAGFPEDKAYLIRYYICRLYSNYDNVCDLLDTNSLDWYSKTLDEVVQITTDIKLKKSTTGIWVTVHPSSNAVGKQGTARPSNTIPTDSVTTLQETNSKDFLKKISNLTGSKVTALLQMHSCHICKKTTHPLWRCNAM